MRVLDNLSTGDRANLAAHASDVEFLEGDIRDAEAVEASMAGVDWVFHLAAKVSVPESVSHPQRVLDVNVRGAALVAYAAAAAGVERLIFASSCAVYGECGRAPVAETTPTSPLSPYGASKLMGECLLGELHRSGRLPALCCRFFNVYGTRQRADSAYAGVVAQFMDRVARGEALTIFGDGQQTRDFVSVSDVVGLLLHAAGQDPARWPEVVNVGTGAPATVRETADLIRACAPGQPPIVFADERRGDLRHSCADITRARTVLGWTPRMSLSDGLAALWTATNP